MKNIKVWLTPVLIALFFGWTGLAGVQPARAGDVVLSVSSAQGNVGDMVEVEVNLTEVTSLAGGSFNLVYDSRLVTPATNGVTSGDFINGFLFMPNPDFSVGNSKAVRVVWASSGSTSGSGQVCSISFKLLKSGTSALQFNGCQLTDKDLKTIPSSATDGSIIVNGDSTASDNGGTSSSVTGGSSSGGSSTSGSGGSGSTGGSTANPVTPPASTGASTLNDISQHWAKSYVERLVTSGVLSGYPDSTFKPDNTITRAEFARIMFLALKLPTSNTGTDFKDWTGTAAWARTGIAAAVKAGIINGYDDGTFRPDQPISRAEMAVIIMRAKNAGASSGNAVSFSDSNQIPVWALPYVQEAVQLKIITGKDNNQFKPNDQATRAEAACMLCRLLDN